jgi:transposase-like protein
MNRYAPCPNCNAQEANEIGYTWWGGIVGPKLFTHVKCSKCGTTYNGKTGKSNQEAIAIYVTFWSIIGIVIVLVIHSQKPKTIPGNSVLLQSTTQA